MVLYVLTENGKVKRVDTLEHYINSGNAKDEASVDAQMERTNERIKNGLWQKVVLEGESFAIVRKIIEFLFNQQSIDSTYGIENAILSCEKTLSDVSSDLCGITSELDDIKDMIKKLKIENEDDKLF